MSVHSSKNNNKQTTQDNSMQDKLTGDRPISVRVRRTKQQQQHKRSIIRSKENYAGRNNWMGADEFAVVAGLEFCNGWVKPSDPTVICLCHSHMTLMSQLGSTRPVQITCSCYHPAHAQVREAGMRARDLYRIMRQLT